ncbi:MAG: LysR family transcriptional regulator, partial [Ramlibacter sp.]
MFDWDDLKHFLAVAQHGSTTAAGRALRLDQSTVQRRLGAFEQQIGQPLVQRHPTGTRLTAYGEQLLAHARRVEHEMLALREFIQSSARELNGVIRLTCPEPIVTRITRSPLLERLQARHPGLHLEFVMSDRYIDLAKGEADVALRSGDTDDNRLIGRKVGDSHWGVYAGQGYVAQYGSPAGTAQLADHPWIGFDASMANHRATQWLAGVAPGARIVATSTGVLGLIQLARANVGLAAMPCALGDAEPELVRLLGPVPELTRIWRMLTTR